MLLAGKRPVAGGGLRHTPVSARAGSAGYRQPRPSRRRERRRAVGHAILALKRNGVDGNRRIIGAKAPTPYLFNLPPGFVERFRAQIEVVDLINEGSPDVVRQAVWSCYQESPTRFSDGELYDPGAFPEPPLSGRITWRVTNPEREPRDETERRQVGKLKEIMDRARAAAEAKGRRDGEGKVSQ